MAFMSKGFMSKGFMSIAPSLIYLGFAFFYLTFAEQFSVEFQALFKILPLLWLLAVYLGLIQFAKVVQSAEKQSTEVSKNRQSRVVFIALSLSMVGDVILALDGKNWFVYGLAAFLLSHLAYIIALMPLKRLSFMRTFGLVLCYLLLAYSILRLMAPNLGPMLIPVCFYITVILLMSLTTWHSQLSNAWLISGGLLFISSDAAIGISRFYQAFAGQGEFIMITYYAAQFALLRGFAQQRLDRATDFSKGNP